MMTMARAGAGAGTGGKGHRESGVLAGPTVDASEQPAAGGWRLLQLVRVSVQMYVNVYIWTQRRTVSRRREGRAERRKG